MIATSIEAAVHWLLISDPRTAAWFGFRVTPVVATQGTTRADDGGILPFAVFKIVSTDEQVFLDLGEAPPTAIVVAVEVYAETYDAVKAAAAAVRSVLSRATGTRYGATMYFSLLQSGTDDIAVPVDGKGLPLYAVTLTFAVRIQEVS